MVIDIAGMYIEDDLGGRMLGVITMPGHDRMGKE